MTSNQRSPEDAARTSEYWKGELLAANSEIERLTAELALFHRYYGGSQSLTVERNELIAERDRLRAALRGALECVECNDAQGAETIINVALRPADETSSCRHGHIETQGDPGVKHTRCLDCGDEWNDRVCEHRNRTMAGGCPDCGDPSY